MSHFTVLIIGANPKAQLEPFKESGAGASDEYLQFVDKTAEVTKEYEKESCDVFYAEQHMEVTKKLFDALKKSKVGRQMTYVIEKRPGMIHAFYGGKKYSCYYPLKNGKRGKGEQWFEVLKVVETKHPDKNVCFEGELLVQKISRPKKIAFKDKYGSLDEFAREWHGYKEKIDGKYGYHDNPNGKWDWAILGGRWTGFFKLKDGATGIPGEPGLMTKPSEPGYADAVLKRDIDFDGMRQEAIKKAAEQYDKAMEVIGHLPVNKTWEQMRGKISVKNMDKCRTRYWNQPRCKAWTEAGKKDKDSNLFGFMSSPDEYRVSREDYLKLASDEAITTFAVLKDGKWYERGKMGFWAVVHDEKDKNVWNEEFNKLVEGLPDDTLLSVYDCHV